MRRFLIISSDSRKKIFPLKRTTEVNWPLIRECIEKTFPNWNPIYTPLDPATAGTFEQVLVYESQDKNGVGRQGTMHQWLVEVK